MKNISMIGALAACALAWAAEAGGAPAGSAPAAAPKVDLGPTYTDAFRGFSIRPPADAEQVKVTSPRRLVSWVRRDPKTKAIRWTLEVLHTRHKPSTLPLEEYAQAVARELSQDGFKVESVRTGLVAGKPAMHFRGVWSGALRLWRRQTWIKARGAPAPPADTGPSTAPARVDVNLILDIHGVETDKAEMDATLTAVADSLRIFESVYTLERRKDDLKRGQDALAGLDEKALRALLAPATQYYLVSLAGNTVGFFQVTESMAQRWPATGASVVRSGCLKLPKEARQLIHEELFATADRATERWKRTEGVGSGADTEFTVQEALKQRELLLVQTQPPGQARRSRQEELPEEVRAAYLPQAFSLLLPRLIDRSRPGSFGFAVYNPAVEGFDFRLVRVVGPERITVGGQAAEAVRLSEQPAPDAPAADLWVDEKGLLLRMKSGGDLLIERSDRKTVIDRFAADLIDLGRLGGR